LNKKLSVRLFLRRKKNTLGKKGEAAPRARMVETGRDSGTGPGN